MANLIQKLRERHGLNKYRFSRLCNKTCYEVGRYENCKSTKIESLEYFAGILGDTEILEKIEELKNIVSQPK